MPVISFDRGFRSEFLCGVQYWRTRAVKGASETRGALEGAGGAKKGPQGACEAKRQCLARVLSFSGSCKFTVPTSFVF